MHRGILFCIAALVVILLYGAFRTYPYLIIRCSRNNRKIILTLKRLHKHPSDAFYALTQKAKFAPSCTDEDVAIAKQLYRSEKKQGKNAWKRSRRDGK